MSAKTADDSIHIVLPDGMTADEYFTLGPDKKTATIKIDGKSKDGSTFHQTLFYERLK